MASGVGMGKEAVAQLIADCQNSDCSDCSVIFQEGQNIFHHKARIFCHAGILHTILLQFIIELILCAADEAAGNRIHQCIRYIVEAVHAVSVDLQIVDLSGFLENRRYQIISII